MLRPPKARTDRPPTVVLVDRQPLFAAAISTLLSSPPISAAVRVLTRLEDLQWLPDPEIDLIICELRSQPMTGIELMSALNRDGYTIPVILLGESLDKVLMLEAMQLGADGLFEKNTPVEFFVSGVLAVLQGYRAIGPSLLEFSIAKALVSVRGEQPARSRS